MDFAVLARRRKLAKGRLLLYDWHFVLCA